MYKYQYDVPLKRNWNDDAICDRFVYAGWKELGPVTNDRGETVLRFVSDTYLPIPDISDLQ